MNMVSNKGKIFSLSLAHMFNDFYMNYIQTLLPFLVAAGLGVSKGAFLISAFTVTSSVLQPVFGYLVDQKNQRWLVYVGTIWMAVLISLVGLLKNYSLLILVAALAGLGTAAFHPQASAMVSAVSGNRKGFWQSCFTAGGNVGWALTPLLVVPFVQAYNLVMTPLFILPGVLVAIMLWFSAPRVSSEAKMAPPPLMPILRSNWFELTKLVFVVAIRSLAYFGLMSFLPLYLQKTNISLLTGSHLLFVMLFCGAIGGVVGGYLSDRIGRKAVIVGSLVLSSPLFFFFLNTNGFYAYVLLALAGAALLASFSVTVVVAQNIISKNAAMASGLMLGFGIGIGGLGVGLVGILVEYSSITFAINLLIWLPLLAGLSGLALKTKKRPDVSER
ncbi:MFS transporter [Dehalobacter restrictus]|uniref:MFS transporter n=1 Tax=Dehalobacter restrictus TaxID=55583 RepID=A0A857DEN9_9FIRM|nr:MFS transporter [Dehalobacter restrictus]QGZ99180.1 MFS transporter [Dehalobacter restrictus]